MPITVGQDSARARKHAGGRRSDRLLLFHSPPRTEAGLGDFSRLPAALKVVLENMLRFEDGKTVSDGRYQAPSPNGPKMAAGTRARLPIARRAC